MGYFGPKKWLFGLLTSVKNIFKVDNISSNNRLRDVFDKIPSEVKWSEVKWSEVKWCDAMYNAIKNFMKN
jgi:hypothetical protein